MRREADARDGAALDDFVRAYETARGGGRPAELSEFLPPREHPLYAAVLRELVRVDLELNWTAGRPGRLRDYRAAFPELFADPAALADVAFEEYRLRLQAGEQPSPEEYRRDFGVRVESWPTFPPPAVPAGLAGPHRAFPPDGSAESWEGPLPGGESSLALLREVQGSDPELAYLLAQAMVSLPEVGSTFLDFRLLAELGRGSFGRAYLAQQGGLANRPVALKVSLGLLAEPQALAQLQHTNIVPVYSAHQAGPFQAVCMPYFGPTTLADVLAALRKREALPESGAGLVEVLRERAEQLPSRLPPPGPGAPLHTWGRLPYAEAALWIGARLAEGLGHAHQHGILHRDLKPANVLLTDEGQPMLLDFNLSADTKLPAAAEAARVGGTLAYMAPEHLDAFRGGAAAVDARSDLYSLGVILFELLTGRRPFPPQEGPPEDALPRLVADRLAPPPRLRCWNRAVSPATEAIVHRLLEPEPARRYPSARELREDLQCQLDSLPLRHTAEPSVRERVRKWARRHRRLTAPVALAAYALGLAGLGLALFFWHQYRGGQERLEQAETAAVTTRTALTQVRQEKEQTEESLSAARLEVLTLKRAAEKSLEQFRDALGSVRGRADEVGGLRSAFDAGHPGDEQPAEEVERCRAALARYRVLQDPAWEKAEGVRLLPADEQERLRHDVGELLYLLARALLVQSGAAAEATRGWAAAYALPAPGVVAAEAARAAVRARLEEALAANRRAEGCYPPGGAPRALLMQRAALLGLLENGAEAGRLLRRARALHPQGARDLYLAAYEEAALGDFGRALPLAREARDAGPRQPGAWFLLGLCHANRAAPAEAVRCFDVCLALAPEWALARFNRGLAYFDLEQWSAARADFDVVVCAWPEWAEPYVQRALAVRQMKKYPEALRDLDEALKLRPSYPCASYLRGELRRQVGDSAGAAEDFGRVLRDEPADAEAWFYRGKVRAAQDPDGAADDYREALRLAPRFTPALEHLAALLDSRPGRAEEALRVLDRALEYYPGSVYFRLRRGLLEARLGRADAARRDAEAALEHDRSPATKYDAGCVYALTSRGRPGDARKAVRLLGEALREGYGWNVLPADSRLAPLDDDPDFRRLVGGARLLRAAGP